MGGKKKYIEVFGSFAEPFNSTLIWWPFNCSSIMLQPFETHVMSVWPYRNFIIILLIIKKIQVRYSTNGVKHLVINGCQLFIDLLVCGLLYWWRTTHINNSVSGHRGVMSLWPSWHCDEIQEVEWQSNHVKSGTEDTYTRSETNVSWAESDRSAIGSAEIYLRAVHPGFLRGKTTMPISCSVGLGRNSPANSKCTFLLTFQDEQKQNTKQYCNNNRTLCFLLQRARMWHGS